ncbi:hypothetical protein KSF78_0008016 [Schistosoma japonicum]|nr:hypothetical protein KSF78_0008016 [Schistosoma japonicum]
MSMSIHCDVDYCIIEVRSGSKCILLKFYVSINGMSTDNCALNSGLHSVVAFGECQQQLSVQKVTIYTLGVILYMCLHEFKYDIISVVVAAVLAIPSIVLSFRVIVLTPYFFKLYDLTKDYTLYYLLSVFLFEIVCSCSLMLFSFTPIDPLSCENKTVSN